MKHHYIPELYTKRWATNPNKKLYIARKIRKENKIAQDLRSPSEVGFKTNLYSIEGLDGVRDHIVETEYFNKIDNMSSLAFDKLETGNFDYSDVIHKSSICRFITSTLLRNPQSFVKCISATAEMWRRAINRKFNIEMGGFINVDGIYLPAQVPDRRILENYCIHSIDRTIDNELLGSFINGLTWFTRDIKSSFLEFMISDRPICMPYPLEYKNAFIAFPINPKKIIFITRLPELGTVISKSSDENVIRNINSLIVRQSYDQIYSTCGFDLQSLHLHFGSSPANSWIDQMYNIVMENPEFPSEEQLLEDAYFIRRSIASDMM